MSPGAQTEERASLGHLSVIDCDAHFTEPPDLWTSRAPASWKDKVPVMRTGDDGISSWFLDDSLFASIGGNTINRAGEREHGIISIQPWDEIHKASWDAKARVALLDEMGIYAQVLYPNAMGFAGNMAFAIDDLQQRDVINRVYNDFLVDVQQESGNRLFPQALLPIWDMDLTVKEMTRLREGGITGFTITDKPHAIDLPDLDTDYFAPMWALGNEMGAVFNFHVGSGAGPKSDPAVMAQLRAGTLANLRNPDQCFDSFGPLRRIVVTACQAFMSNARIIVNLCMGDLFDRYPKIKIFSVESGLGWIPFVLECMEYHLDEIVSADPAEANAQQRRPTEYFRDHFYASFWFERVAPLKLIEDIGVNNVLVETDVPHPSCLYPDPLQRLGAATAEWDPHVRKRIFQDNAVELFGIPLPVKS